MELEDFFGDKGFKAEALSEFFKTRVVYTNAETNGMTQFFLDYSEIYPTYLAF